MSIVKYRPTLTSNEIQDIINALESHNPASSALATLKVYAYKQSLGLVKPATIAKEQETEEQRQAKIQKELEDSTNFFKAQARVNSSQL